MAAYVQLQTKHAASKEPSWEFIPLEEFLQHKWILQSKGHWPDPRNWGYRIH